MSQPLTFLVPLTDVEIDGDKRCAVIHIADAEAFFKTLVGAISHPGLAAVMSNVPEEEVEE